MQSATPSSPVARAFSSFSKFAARTTGHATAFLLACLAIAGWAAMGPVFGFSDSWQLTINTTTTIVTFLMVFVIQNTQARDMEAMQIKLDEMLRATKGTRMQLLDLEELPEEDLRVIQKEYEKLAARARKGDLPDVPKAPQAARKPK